MVEKFLNRDLLFRLSETISDIGFSLRKTELLLRKKKEDLFPVRRYEWYFFEVSIVRKNLKINLFVNFHLF